MLSIWASDNTSVSGVSDGVVGGRRDANKRPPLHAAAFHERVDAYPLIFLPQDKTKTIYHVHAASATRPIKKKLLINYRFDAVSKNLTVEQVNGLKRGSSDNCISYHGYEAVLYGRASKSPASPLLMGGVYLVATSYAICKSRTEFDKWNTITKYIYGIIYTIYLPIHEWTKITSSLLCFCLRHCSEFNIFSIEWLTYFSKHLLDTALFIYYLHTCYYK